MEKAFVLGAGLGTRLRPLTDQLPKPLVPVGERPILWHLMRYYSHFGHNEFILCLGYRADLIKEFFLKHDQALYADVRVSNNGRSVEFLEETVDWRVSLVDTGIDTNIGERLRAVKPYLDGEEMFLANYSDALSDLPLAEHVADFAATDAIGSFVCVKPSQTFHPVTVGDDGVVSEIRPVRQSPIWINGGYFTFRREIFDFLHEGEELVDEPFQRLIADGKLRARKYQGFWSAMDTMRDKAAFDRMVGAGDTPWMVWKQ